MSRQYNPAVAAYKRMDLDAFNKLDKAEESAATTKQGSGLLARSKPSDKSNSGIDYKNPAVRVAKQMQVIRKYRDEINGSK